MKELDKKAFDQSYKYDDYKKQIKRECKQRQEATTKEIGIKILIKVYKKQAQACFLFL